MENPVIILAPPHSFTSIVSAMLGQHPQMYGLPEVNLFVAETMQERAGIVAQPGWQEHGLLRVVAQLFRREQTVRTIAFARQWMNVRANRTCVSVFRELAEQVGPRILVEKSPRTTSRSEYLQRIRRAFPSAKFIHISRHPRSTGESLWKPSRAVLQSDMPSLTFPVRSVSRGLMVANAATHVRASPLPVQEFSLDYSTHPPIIDFQKVWYTMHMNILTFLDGLPEEQKMRVRGEDLLAEPDLYLYKIAEWLGVRTDEEAINTMKHPEQSPYACLGPVNARLGNNIGFLKSPALRAGSPAKAQSLEGPLSWRKDREGFSSEVKELAREFGYV